MKFYIDQSGKIENTNKLTIVAFANGKTKSIKINGREKRKLVTYFRRIAGLKKIYIYKIFSAMIFLLLKGERVEYLIIDREYPGHEGKIKLDLIAFFQKSEKSLPDISFTLITKNSPAHKIAIDTFRGKRKADVVVSSEDVLKLFSNKKGWRSLAR